MCDVSGVQAVPLRCALRGHNRSSCTLEGLNLTAVIIYVGEVS
jgi:hypothetical protein